MRSPEWIALGYFTFLIAGAAVRRLPPAARRRLVGVASGLLAAVLLVAQLPASPLVAAVRDWFPGVYLIAGYWLSGLFFVTPASSVEDRLARLDAWVFERISLRRLIEAAPRGVLEYLEAAYLLVYPLVPGALLVLFLLGHQAHADRFWTVVLVATYGSYGTLVFLQTRPPRALEPAPAIESRRIWLRTINLMVLDRGSIQVNTLPSGHAAGALAAALVVCELAPLAGSLLIWLAGSIAVASVIGRYHYLLDSISGLVLAIVAWLLV